MIGALWGKDSGLAFRRPTPHAPKLVDKLVGLRVDEQAEDIGLDLAEHNETAYNH